MSSGIGTGQVAIVEKNREFDQTLSPNFHGRREKEIEEEEEDKVCWSGRKMKMSKIRLFCEGAKQK